MTFSEALKNIYDVQEDQRLTFALNKFGHLFSKDIVEYLFVRHCGCYSLPLFRYFDYIDIEHCQIKLECITSEQVFNLVDYAPALPSLVATFKYYGGIEMTRVRYVSVRTSSSI